LVVTKLSTSVDWQVYFCNYSSFLCEEHTSKKFGNLSAIFRQICHKFGRGFFRTLRFLWGHFCVLPVGNIAKNFFVVVGLQSHSVPVCLPPRPAATPGQLLLFRHSHTGYRLDDEQAPASAVNRTEMTTAPATHGHITIVS
jgi:hypothetical protein